MNVIGARDSGSVFWKRVGTMEKKREHDSEAAADKDWVHLLKATTVKQLLQRRRASKPLVVIEKGELLHAGAVSVACAAQFTNGAEFHTQAIMFVRPSSCSLRFASREQW
jgi:hypothetical protein